MLNTVSMLAANGKVLLPLFFTMAYNTVLVGESNSYFY